MDCLKRVSWRGQEAGEWLARASGWLVHPQRGAERRHNVGDDKKIRVPVALECRAVNAPARVSGVGPKKGTFAGWAMI
jgi:hypothetical protein